MDAIERFMVEHANGWGVAAGIRFGPWAAGSPP
jgi:hypothetical protein